MAQMWRSEVTFQESVRSLYHVGPGTGTQVMKFGSKKLPTEPSHQAGLTSFLKTQGQF